MRKKTSMKRFLLVNLIYLEIYNGVSKCTEMKTLGFENHIVCLSWFNKKVKSCCLSLSKQLALKVLFRNKMVCWWFYCDFNFLVLVKILQKLKGFSCLILNLRGILCELFSVPNSWRFFLMNICKHFVFFYSEKFNIFWGFVFIILIKFHKFNSEACESFIYTKTYKM